MEVEGKQEHSSEQVVLSLPLQDKEDGEPKTKQLREGEEESEKHRYCAVCGSLPCSLLQSCWFLQPPDSVQSLHPIPSSSPHGCLVQT